MNTLKYAFLIFGLGVGAGLFANASESGEIAATSSAPAATAHASSPAPGAPLVSLLQPGNPALPKTIYTEVYLRESGEPIKGDLITYDESLLTIKTAKDERKLQWIDLTGASAFTLRARLIDKTQPRHWFALGQFAWGMGSRDQAQMALDRATALDRAIKPEVEAVLKTEPGSLLKPASTVTPSTSTPTDPPAEPPVKNTPPKKGAPGELFPNVKTR